MGWDVCVFPSCLLRHHKAPSSDCKARILDFHFTCTKSALRSSETRCRTIIQYNGRKRHIDSCTVSLINQLDHTWQLLLATFVLSQTLKRASTTV